MCYPICHGVLGCVPFVVRRNLLGESYERRVAAHGVAAHKPSQATGSVPHFSHVSPKALHNWRTSGLENSGAELMAKGITLPDKWGLRPAVGELICCCIHACTLAQDSGSPFSTIV